MKTRLLVLGVVLVIAAGCVEKRKPAGSGEAPQPAQAAPEKDAPSSAEIVHDYTKNLSTAPSRAAAVVDIASIQKAVSTFEAMEGRLPKSLNELVMTRYLPQLPPVPQGQRLEYDAATGKVTLVAR